VSACTGKLEAKHGADSFWCEAIFSLQSKHTFSPLFGYFTHALQKLTASVTASILRHVKNKQRKNTAQPRSAALRILSKPP